MDNRTNLRNWLVILPALAVVFTPNAWATGTYDGGDGSSGDPFQINTPAQMNEIGQHSEDWDKCFILTANINLSAYIGTSFNIIGNDVNSFTGVFDGNDHTISNFTYTSTGTYQIGVFGYVAGESAEIRDLGLINPDIDGGSCWDVGSLVGYLWLGAITNCYVQGGSVSGEREVGGLVGYNQGTITNCYSTGGSVSGEYNVGGLVGFGGTITNCYSTSRVTGFAVVGGLVGTGQTTTNCYSAGSVLATVGTVGGLVGYSISTISNCYAISEVSGGHEVGGLVGYKYSGEITNCYSTGSVVGSEKVGGLVGYNRDPGTVSNCYSTGSVSGTTNVGGLIGYNNGSTSDLFWDKQSSGRSNMCGYQDPNYGSGCDDGNGKTTVEMQDVNTFLSAGWDFVGEYGNGPSDNWSEPSGGGYMILWWQLDPLPALPTFSGGTGEPNDPYLISTFTDLNRIGHNPRLMGAHFKLIDDINLTGIEFFSIGSLAHYYTGVFDGNDHTISNLTVDSNGIGSIGIFSYVSGLNAEIKDLGMIDPNIDAGTGSSVGSLVGYISNGTISGSYVEGGSVSGNKHVGGLAGSNSRGTISNCYVEGGSVSADERVGGLVGNNDGTITNCHSVASVSGTGLSISGLLGTNAGTVTECYSAGSVSGPCSVGGLVGGNYGEIVKSYSLASVLATDDRVGGLVGSNTGTISNCCATGEVSGLDIVGGLAGKNTYGTLTNCYSSASVSGENIVGGLAGQNLQNSTISNCYSTAIISGIENIGGLVGFNYGDVDDCYAIGEVTGVMDVGGLVGENGYHLEVWNTYWGTVANCYAAGPVSGVAYVGGLLGNNDGEIGSSFWDVNTCGPSNMCGRVGAHGSGCDDSNGLPTPDMQTESTFTSAGWDFVGEVINGPNDIWEICEGTNYPKLTCQVPVLGDLGCPDGVDWIDVSILSDQWLQVGEYSADIAPVPDGDGIVDFRDFAAQAANSLAGR